ncbi:MAG: magnesium/cobalt transporter CorA [Rhodothermales bacterium]
MLRHRRKPKRPGLPPGTLVYTGAPRTEQVQISVIDYDAEAVREKPDANTADCIPVASPATVTWVNVNGVHDATVIEAIGRMAGLHPLVMEDIVNTGQRPKFESYETYAFIELYMLHERKDQAIDIEQVSLVVGKGFVISFQEYEGDVFTPVIERIRNGKGNIRKMGADYLAYVLVDTIVDHYFHVVELAGEKMDAIESQLLLDAHDEVLYTINDLKREVLHLRRAIWPMREVVAAMDRNEDRLFDKKTRIYLRDVYDHVVQVIEMLESQRDALASLTELYLSTQSQRMNEVMKFLTIIGTIFIPLTFVVGIYGMNFDHMPELHWMFGYPVVMGIMAVMALGLVLYFKRKKWL